MGHSHGGAGVQQNPSSRVIAGSGTPTLSRWILRSTRNSTRFADASEKPSWFSADLVRKGPELAYGTASQIDNHGGFVDAFLAANGLDGNGEPNASVE
jgi:hypothetical protein